ncbi:MAG: helix-turn-helix transcriptional regulator, partial [Clostridia bacterium]|nr:helix-turn-helix transcriptional regulator [Clostridia bacterium]
MEERITGVYSEGADSLERHFHNTHELIYVQSGMARFRVGDATYEAGAGSLLFISKLEEHSVEVVAEPYRRWWVRLTAEQLAAATDEARLRTVFERRPPEFCHLFDVSPIADEVGWILGEIAKESPATRSFQRHRTGALIELLLIACYRLRREQFPLPTHRVSGTVLEAQAYLDEHFAEDVTLEALAGRFFLSPSYLSHAFREWTGHSPKQYQMLCRLSFARELLLTTGHSVADIAARCGFGDVNNF